jgi:hypothetical protein
LDEEDEMAKLSVKAGTLFCIWSSVYYGEDALICGPYQAKINLDGDELLREFITWSASKRSNLGEMHDYAKKTMQKPLLDAGNDQSVDLAFIAWLEQTGKIDKLPCDLLSISNQEVYSPDYPTDNRVLSLSMEGDRNTSSEMPFVFMDGHLIDVVTPIMKKEG